MISSYCRGCSLLKKQKARTKLWCGQMTMATAGFEPAAKGL